MFFPRLGGREQRPLLAKSSTTDQRKFLSSPGDEGRTGDCQLGGPRATRVFADFGG